VVAPGTRPRTRRPRRLAAPAFEPPEELRQAGAPEARIRVCVDAAGHVTSLSYDRQRGPAQLHPRHMGAALDWARRFAYDRSEWAPGITQMCEFHRARFDGPVAVPRPDADFETDFGRGP
jgi:hypothetical protein